MIYWRLKIQCCSGEHPIVTQNDWTVSKINDMGQILYIYVTNPIYPLELYNLRNHHNPAVFCCRGKNNGTMLPSGNQT